MSESNTNPNTEKMTAKQLDELRKQIEAEQEKLQKEYEENFSRSSSRGSKLQGHDANIAKELQKEGHFGGTGADGTYTLSWRGSFVGLLTKNERGHWVARPMNKAFGTRQDAAIAQIKQLESVDMLSTKDAPNPKEDS